MAMLAAAQGDWSETFARWSKPASDTEDETPVMEREEAKALFASLEVEPRHTDRWGM